MSFATLIKSQNCGVGLENTYAEPMDMTLPTISPNTCDIETQIQIESDTLSEQPPLEGGVSPQSPNSRRIHLSEKLLVNFGNNTPTIDIPSPLIVSHAIGRQLSSHLLILIGPGVVQPPFSQLFTWPHSWCRLRTTHIFAIDLVPTEWIRGSYWPPALPETYTCYWEFIFIFN